MIVSNMLRQSAGMAVQKSINRWLHHAFEPFFQGIYLFQGLVWMAWSAIYRYNCSAIIIQVTS